MRKLHVTQDDSGFWILSLEQPDGSLELISHQGTSRDHVIDSARELVEKKYADATIIIDPPVKPVSDDPSTWPQNYRAPAPRKAGTR